MWVLHRRGMGLGSPTQNSALGGPFQPMDHRQDADATSVAAATCNCPAAFPLTCLEVAANMIPRAIFDSL
jgi:hypothetical protein